MEAARERIGRGNAMNQIERVVDIRIIEAKLEMRELTKPYKFINRSTYRRAAMEGFGSSCGIDGYQQQMMMSQGRSRKFNKHLGGFGGIF